MSRRTRIVLAVLVVWTAVHLFLWALGGFMTTGELNGVRYVGLWPFHQKRVRDVQMPAYEIIGDDWGARPVIPGPLDPRLYDPSELIFYVGLPWAAFAAYCLITSAPKKPENDGEDPRA